MNKSRRNKALKRVTIIVTFFCIITYVAFTYIIPYAILQPKRLLIATDPATISSDYKKLNIAIDSLGELRGYLFKPVAEKPKAILILIHGIGGAKEHFFPLASRLKDEGIASIAIDNRAHGESDGKYVTYGYFEKHDVEQIVTYLKKEYPHTPIGI